MKRVISAALLASAILLTATAAKAVPLFENPFPSTDWGIGPCSSCFGIGRAWDSFTLGADSKISQIDSDLIFIGDVSTINYSIWDASLTTEIFSQTFTPGVRSEEHTSELQSLMRISYAVFCLKKKNTEKQHKNASTKQKQ